MWAELKRKEVEYDRRRNKKVQYFESVRHAQTVQIDDIPLPQMGDQPAQPPPRQNIDINQPAPNLPGKPSLPNLSGFDKMQMPPDLIGAKPAIGPIQTKIVDSKDTPGDSSNDKSIKNLPGCPPGPPPKLQDLPDLDSDYESDESDEETITPPDEVYPPVDTSRQQTNPDKSVSREDDDDSDEEDVREPTSVQKRILALSGQTIDDFMKELENVRKKKDTDVDHPSAKYKEPSADKIIGREDESNRSKASESNQEQTNRPPNMLFQSQTMPPLRPPNTLIPPPMKLPNPPPPPMGIPPNMPPNMMFRPPPLRPGLQSLGMRMPQGMNPQGMPRLRMPPGPPPGIPPSRMGHPPFNKSMHPNTGPPQPPQQKSLKDTKGMTTISAKPQIRNLSADVTRFVPSTLRVKREDKKLPKKNVMPYSRHTEQAAKAAGTTKDDAYMQFMQEMQGLL